MQQQVFMSQAIELAALGKGRVSPNPPVGCVIVKDGLVVGRGYHQKFGEAHAEVSALNDAGDLAQNADVYVTLMPCSHHGKTPPCTEALIKAGVKKVFVAVDDADPVSGNGKEILERAGIVVNIGILHEEAMQVMHGFFKFLKTGLPHITLKYAMTLDGAIATETGDSKWISSSASREYVQNMRMAHDAIMVGSGTVKDDDPQLNIRGECQKQPLRIIIDSQLTTSPEARMFGVDGGKVIILAAQGVDEEKVNALQDVGAEIIHTQSTGKHLDLNSAMKDLAIQYGVRDILCEGGSGLAGALMQARLIDEVVAFIAPKMIGGQGLCPVSAQGAKKMQDAILLKAPTTEVIGCDIVMRGFIG